MAIWVEILGNLKMDERIKFGRVCQSWHRNMPLRVRILDFSFENSDGGNGMWIQAVDIDKALGFLLPVTGARLRAVVAGNSFGCDYIDQLIHHCPFLQLLRIDEIGVAQAGLLASGSLKKMCVNQLLLSDTTSTSDIERFSKIEHIEVEYPVPSGIVGALVSVPTNVFGFRNLAIDVKNVTSKMLSMLILQCPFIEYFLLNNIGIRRKRMLTFELSNLKYLKNLRRLRMHLDIVPRGLEEVFFSLSNTLEIFEAVSCHFDDFKFLAHGGNLKRLSVCRRGWVPVASLTELPETAPLTDLQLGIDTRRHGDIAKVFATLAKKGYLLEQLLLQFWWSCCPVQTGAPGLCKLLSGTSTLRFLSIEGLVFHDHVFDDLLEHASQLEFLHWNRLPSEEALLAFLRARKDMIQRGVPVSHLSMEFDANPKFCDDSSWQQSNSELIDLASVRFLVTDSPKDFDCYAV